jgi:Fe-S-cluster-containing hydrogenase component 2
MTYDYTDQQVVELITGTHIPDERPQVTVNDIEPVKLTLVCRRCIEPWPCAAIQGYRDFKESTKTVRRTGAS